jgi:hypothetical protein
VDRVLATLVSRAFRRGVRGEPLWLAVGAGLWLVRRMRNKDDSVVWSGKLDPGQKLVIRTREPDGDSAIVSSAPAEV